MNRRLWMLLLLLLLLLLLWTLLEVDVTTAFGPRYCIISFTVLVSIFMGCSFLPIQLLLLFWSLFQRCILLLARLLQQRVVFYASLLVKCEACLLCIMQLRPCFAQSVGSGLVLVKLLLMVHCLLLALGSCAVMQASMSGKT